MLSKNEKEIEEIFDYLDKKYWDNKVSDTNWYYEGLVFDELFECSSFSNHYLSFENFMRENQGLVLNEHMYLIEQVKKSTYNEKVKTLSCLLSLLHNIPPTDYSVTNINRIESHLKKNGFSFSNDESNFVNIYKDTIIGEGSFCEIVLVDDVTVLKRLKNTKINDLELKKRLRYEYDNMKKLSSCEQVIKVYEMIDDTQYTMQRAECDLYEYIQSHIIDDSTLMYIINDILHAIKSLHQNNIIHRDLHPGNILYLKDIFVLSDFGLSKDLKKQRTLRTSSGQKNNHRFLDPRVMSNFKNADIKADIYSIGKIIEYIVCIAETEHKKKIEYIIENCIGSRLDSRYSTVVDIISDFNRINNDICTENKEEQILIDIKSNKYNINVDEYICNICNDGKLAKFILDNRLYSFDKLFINFSTSNQLEFINAIKNEYVDATGFGGWSNYDTFGRICFNIYNNVEYINIKDIAKAILKECSVIRFSMKKLYDEIK